MKSGSIIIVDDDTSFREELASVFRMKGFKVMEAEHCMVALQLIREKRPDVAIIDRRMPNGDGQKWMEIFKKASEKTSFIILTAFGDYDSAIEGYKTDLVGYFDKPPDLEKLVSKIEKLISKKNQASDISGKISEIAHEIINPLSIISESLDCTREGLGSQITKETEKMLDISARQISRLSKFTRALINSDIIEKGAMPFKPKNTEIAPLLKDMVEDISADFIKHNIKIDLQIDPDVGSACFDGELFSHVFFNLAHNAIKYSPRGSTVQISIKKYDDGFMMSVSDEGPEIPNSEKESIFEKYHKVKGNDQPGSGIGLYIVKQIVDLHGGKVNVESKNGHGSTFNVWMPNDACKGNGGKYEKNNDSR